MLTALACISLSASAAKLAIIIDDIGYNYANGLRAVKLNGAYTLSILPLTPHAEKLAKLGHEHNKELMLHNPMSNTKNLALGPGALTEDMTRQAFLQVLRANLIQLPNIRGLNNHMGSRLTQNAKAMGWLMQELDQDELFFIDSKTTTESVAWSVANLYRIPAGKRDVFLDHDRAKEHILKQLKRALALAAEQGSAIAIGHPYPETMDILTSSEKLFAAANVSLVSVSELLYLPVGGNGYCSTPPQYLQSPLSYSERSLKFN